MKRVFLDTNILILRLPDATPSSLATNDTLQNSANLPLMTANEFLTELAPK